jgi:hypothetical protein
MRELSRADGFVIRRQCGSGEFIVERAAGVTKMLRLKKLLGRAFSQAKSVELPNLTVLV